LFFCFIFKTTIKSAQKQKKAPNSSALRCII
jgi:hypothetical protein